MKKLITMLIFGTITGNLFADVFSNNIGGVPLVGITNGKTFSQLPAGKDIKSLANSTIGFTFKTSAGVQNCTGVAISENLLLTANHCTMGIPMSLIDIGTEYLKINTQMTLELSTGKKTSTIKSITRAWEKGQRAYDGDDLAIIQFKDNIFSSFIPKAKIFSSYNYNDIETITDALAAKIWEGKKAIYVFGWGSNQRFQYDTKPIDFPNQQFPIDLYGFYNKINIITPTYNLGDGNGRYSMIGGGIKYNVSPNVASLTNLLEHNIPIEKGDSGGPSFICNSDGNNCNLIGISSMMIDSVAYMVTLANPFYDLIAKPYKF